MKYDPLAPSDIESDDYYQHADLLREEELIENNRINLVQQGGSDKLAGIHDRAALASKTRNGSPEERAADNRRSDCAAVFYNIMSNMHARLDWLADAIEENIRRIEQLANLADELKGRAHQLTEQSVELVLTNIELEDVVDEIAKGECDINSDGSPIITEVAEAALQDYEEKNDVVVDRRDHSQIAEILTDTVSDNEQEAAQNQDEAVALVTEVVAIETEVEVIVVETQEMTEEAADIEDTLSNPDALMTEIDNSADSALASVSQGGLGPLDDPQTRKLVARGENSKPENNPAEQGEAQRNENADAALAQTPSYEPGMGR